MFRLSSSHFAWLLGYIATIALVTTGVFYGRQQAVSIYGSNQAQQDWEDWRTDVQKMSQRPATTSQRPNPVQRRPPKSTEPPALVLMRDHFAVCLTIAIVLSSVLFGTFMLLVQGAARDASPRRSEEKPGNDSL